VNETKDIINIANSGAKFPLVAACQVIETNGTNFIEPIEIPG